MTWHFFFFFFFFFFFPLPWKTQPAYSGNKPVGASWDACKDCEIIDNYADSNKLALSWNSNACNPFLIHKLYFLIHRIGNQHRLHEDKLNKWVHNAAQRAYWCLGDLTAHPWNVFFFFFNSKYKTSFNGSFHWFTSLNVYRPFQIKKREKKKRRFVRWELCSRCVGR